jgi:hypothetical protein
MDIEDLILGYLVIRILDIIQLDWRYYFTAATGGLGAGTTFLIGFVVFKYA